VKEDNNQANIFLQKEPLVVSSGGFVIFQEKQTWELYILLTKKLHHNNTIAAIKKAIFRVIIWSDQKIITALKWGLPKWRIEIEKKETAEEAAKQEVWEEVGITPNNLKIKKYVRSFIKPNRHYNGQIGDKEVKTFIIQTKEIPDKQKPKDKRHIRWTFPLQEGPNFINSKIERNFLEKNMEEIIKLFSSKE